MSGERIIALQDLLDAAMAGDLTHVSGDDIYKAFGSHRQALFIGAYNGSLDAAKALHDAVLPDEGWEVYRTSKYPGMIPGSSQHEFAAKVGWGTTHRGEANNPARAWLCVILKALIAEAKP